MQQTQPPKTPRLFKFGDTLAFSQSVAAATPLETIRSMICGCVSVEAVDNDVAKQRAGVDYVATLRGGAEINIDHKARSQCARYWKQGPELALEKWSVCPHGNFAGVVGWTLDESKITDYTLHTFTETEVVYLIPFQLLRVVTRRNLKLWERQYRTARQRTPRWNGSEYESECVFVPASVVLEAIYDSMWKAA